MKFYDQLHEIYERGSTMKKYNHMFDIAFSVETDEEDPAGVDQRQLVSALLTRIADLVENHEIGEACGHCDSYKNEAKFHLNKERYG